MHGKKREPSEWSLWSPGGLSVLASAVGGLLTRTLVSSQVECVTEKASVYSFHMLIWLLCDLNAAKLFLGVSIFVVPIPALVSQQWTDSKAPHPFI